MSAMLEFYFRFRFRPYLQNRHVILHQPAKVHRNRATHRGVMTLDRFFGKKIQWTQVCRTEHERLQSCEFKGSMIYRANDVTINSPLIYTVFQKKVHP